MKAMRYSTLALAMALTMALAMPSALLAADDTAKAESASPAPLPGDMRVMRQRMLEIHQTTDPSRRQELMAAQLRDMDAVMGGRPCATVDDQGNMVVVGGQGMMGAGMPGTRGMTGPVRYGPTYDAAMDRRMDSLEQRMDMLQMLMRMQMATER